MNRKRRNAHVRMVGAAILLALSAAACIFDQGNPDKTAGRRDSDDSKGDDQSSGSSGASGINPMPTGTGTPDAPADTAQPQETGTDAATDTADTG